MKPIHPRHYQNTPWNRTILSYNTPLMAIVSNSISFAYRWIDTNFIILYNKNITLHHSNKYFIQDINNHEEQFIAQVFDHGYMNESMYRIVDIRKLYI